ncbi:hypothetical protein BU17DRAFT_93686 [Hysterangium stoloniferum]|nr:hypothetical protein BU17DRAFT_93686 [Hysterangium stoloniferum]
MSCPHVLQAFAAPMHHSESDSRVNGSYHSLSPEQTADEHSVIITPFPTYAIVLLTLFILICAFGSAIIFKLLYPVSKQGWKSQVLSRIYSPPKGKSFSSRQRRIVDEASLSAGICASKNNNQSSPPEFGVNGRRMSIPPTSSLLPLPSGSYQDREIPRSVVQSLHNPLHFRVTPISSSPLVSRPRTQASIQNSQTDSAPAFISFSLQSNPSKIFSHLKALTGCGKERKSTPILPSAHVVTHSSKDVLNGSSLCILSSVKAPASTLQSTHSEGHSLTSHSPALSIGPNSGFYSLCEPQLSAGSVLQSFLDFSSPYASGDAFIATAAGPESGEHNVSISGPRYLHDGPLETISEEIDDNDAPRLGSPLSTKAILKDTIQEYSSPKRPDNMKCPQSFSTTSSVVSSAYLLRGHSEEHLELFYRLQSITPSNTQSLLPDIPDEPQSAYHADTLFEVRSELSARPYEDDGSPTMQSAAPVSLHASHPVLSAVSALRSPNINRDPYPVAWQQPVIGWAVKNLEARSTSVPELDHRHKNIDMEEFENIVLPRVENTDRRERVSSSSSTRRENDVSERLFIRDIKTMEFSSGVSHSTFHSALSSFPMSRRASAQTRPDTLEDNPTEEERAGGRADFKSGADEITLISMLQGLSTPRSTKDEGRASLTAMLSPLYLSPASSTASRGKMRTILPSHSDSADTNMKNKDGPSILREEASQQNAKVGDTKYLNGESGIDNPAFCSPEMPHGPYPVMPNFLFASPTPLATLRPLMLTSKSFPRSPSPASSDPPSPDSVVRHISARLMVPPQSFSFDCLVSTPISSPEADFTPGIDLNSPSVRPPGRSYLLPIRLDIHGLDTSQVPAAISSPTPSLNGRTVSTSKFF